MRKALKILRTSAAVAVGAMAAGVLTVGTISGYIDRGHQRDDFRDDVVAMGFKLLPTPEDELNPNWNNVQRGSKLQARVIVGCWVVKLQRQQDEKRLLVSAQGRVIEATVFKAVVSRPRFLERSETNIEDFDEPLTPKNVETYMTNHSDAYPCRTDLRLR